jgi:hypothetical protein
MNVDACKKADFLYEESDFKKFYVGLEDFLTTWNLLSIKWVAEDGHNKDFIWIWMSGKTKTHFINAFNHERWIPKIYKL